MMSRRLAVVVLVAAAPAALAQVVSGPQRTVNWNRALETVAKFRPVVDVSGRVEVAAQIPQGVDA